MLSAFPLRSYAIEPWPEDIYVASEGACLMDADSGTVLFGKNESSAYYPASITKVLTALITLENCNNLSEQVTFSYDAVHIEEENSTIIGASEGDKLSVLDCLYSLLFQSANEVANALAEHVGAKHPELKEEGMSDRDVFIKMMNMKAEELGCTGSHFNNPSGLTDSNHYTTAYDMCLIMAAAIDNDQFLDIESHTYWTHAPIRRYPNADDPWNTVYPKHMMLKKNSSQYYEGTIAGKTGYTMTAGNTLVTACRRGSMTLVSCVLNAHANHYNDTRRLMDFGFDNFISLKLGDYTNIAEKVQNDFSIGGTPMTDAYTMGISPDARIIIPKAGSFVEVEKKLVTDEKSDGETSVKIIYTYGNRQVGEAEFKLMNIGTGSISEAELKAAEDPLLAKILGIEQDESTAAEDTVPENAGTEGEDVKGGELPGEDAGAAQEDKAVSAEKDKVTSDIKEIITKTAPAAAAAVFLLIIFVCARAYITRRRTKIRERRRIARMRKNAYLSGEMHETKSVYRSSHRTLRKIKRKRKR